MTLLWCLKIESLAASADDLQSLLDDDERKRLGQFAFARDALAYAVTRGALRLLLAAELEEDPRAMVLHTGKYGKPFLSPESHSRTVHFNISHSRGVSLLAFAPRAIGVDLEFERKIADILSLAAQCCHRDELVELERVSEQERRSVFFRCWTRKEALTKATGEGLSANFAALDVKPHRKAPLIIRRKPALAFQPCDWTLLDVEVCPGFQAALAEQGQELRRSAVQLQSSSRTSDFLMVLLRDCQRRGVPQHRQHRQHSKRERVHG